MRSKTFFFSLGLAVLLSACGSPATPLAPLDTLEISTQVESAPVVVVSTATPTQEAQPSVVPEASATPEAAGPQFEMAMSGGGPEPLYPLQDISIIAQTGKVQLLNVYANW